MVDGGLRDQVVQENMNLLILFKRNTVKVKIANFESNIKLSYLVQSSNSNKFIAECGRKQSG